MEKVMLGRTGLQVSRLSLGGLFVASFAAERSQAVRTVRRALDLSINYIDTAPSYGNSEEVLGEALAGVRVPVILSTKVGGRPSPFDPRDPAALKTSVEQSLRLLRRDAIDILMVHEPDRPKQYDWWTDWHDLKGPVLDVLEDLKRQGLIRFTGLGGTTVYELAHICRTGRFDVVLTAFNYSLLWREAERTIFSAAQERQMGIVIGSPLQQGALARRYEATIADPRVYWLSEPRREQFRRLYCLCDESGLPLPEMALRFVISNPAIHCVLMGARSEQEVEQNVRAIERGPLPEDVLKALDEIAAMVPYRPYCEPFGIGWFLGNPHQYRGPGPA